MGVVLRDRFAEDQKERREQHETEADAQGRPKEKAVMPSVGRAEKREELDDRRVDSHSRKLGVHHRHADQNIGQPDLLLAQKVRKQQNFVDVPDDDTQIGENRDRDAVALDDAHLLAFYGFNSLAAGFAERAADGDSALFCGITVFSAVSRGRCRCILAAVVSMPFRFWRCLPALHGNIPACGNGAGFPPSGFLAAWAGFRDSGQDEPARFCDGTRIRRGLSVTGSESGAKSCGRRSRAAVTLREIREAESAEGRRAVPVAYILSGTLIPSRPAPEAMTSATVCDSLRRTACTVGSLSRRIGMSW